MVEHRTQFTSSSVCDALGGDVPDPRRAVRHRQRLPAVLPARVWRHLSPGDFHPQAITHAGRAHRKGLTTAVVKPLPVLVAGGRQFRSRGGVDGIPCPGFRAAGSLPPRSARSASTRTACPARKEARDMDRAKCVAAIVASGRVPSLLCGAQSFPPSCFLSSASSLRCRVTRCPGLRSSSPRGPRGRVPEDGPFFCWSDRDLGTLRRTTSKSAGVSDTQLVRRPGCCPRFPLPHRHAVSPCCVHRPVVTTATVPGRLSRQHFDTKRA